MPQFILDILTARGWSVRYLSELTGLSYSGIRDFLHGHPNRLSGPRVQRVYDLLQLDSQTGLLKPDTLYTWRIVNSPEALSALNRVLRVLVECLPATFLEAPGHDPLAYRFQVIPLLGGGTASLPTPFCVFQWQDVWLLIQWEIPLKAARKIGGFHGPKNANTSTRDLAPNLDQIDMAVWMGDMMVSDNKLKGIPLSPSQLSRLQQLANPDHALTLSELMPWLKVEAIEDQGWAASKPQSQPWTWERILQEIQYRYDSPDKAAKALKLR